MAPKKIQFLFPILLFACSALLLQAQIPSGVYISDNENVRQEVKISDDYFIYSEYEVSPPKFIRTLGGFTETYKDKLFVLLEFNSNYTNDSIRKLDLMFNVEDENLQLHWFDTLDFKKLRTKNQDLDGHWLFATRGPDNGQERRGERNTRKTLKVLQDVHFQWIAYDSESLDFKGTGGGSFSSENGIYTENIEYFSRDNARVGASLKFNYKIEGDDWHHTGNNSKGKPMYEIWAKRIGNE
ncbi:hypothetical protein [Maribacter sp. 2210JD10-5]|uniref:hypothetical protein n=1 Tax=Maribacter sp. 2210JD10-5 TaxID=3386272 RepID=UPI0039BD922A